MKSAVQQCNGNAPTQSMPPRLTRAPTQLNSSTEETAAQAQSPTHMPTLTRRPDNSTVDEQNGVDDRTCEEVADEKAPNGELKTESAEAEVKPPNNESNTQEIYNPAHPCLSDEDMEMDISDSDEYDEQEVNMSVSVGVDEPDEQPCPPEPPSNQRTPEPPPLRHRPPPPMRSRPSRFSSIPFPGPTGSAPPPLARAPNAPNDFKHEPDAAQIEPKPELKTEPQQLPMPKFDKIKESIYLCKKDLVQAGKGA